MEKAPMPSKTITITPQPGQTQKVQAKPNQHYRITDSDNITLKADVIAIREGDDLVLRYADNTVVVLEGYYLVCLDEEAGCEVSLPDGSGESVIIATQGTALSDGRVLVYVDGDLQGLLELAQGNQEFEDWLYQQLIDQRDLAQQEAAQKASIDSDGIGGGTLAGIVGVMAAATGGSGGGGGGGGGGAGASAVGFILSGIVTAGPVIDSHGLRLSVYDANGNLLGTTVVNADGTYTIRTTRDYAGLVLIRVVDENTAADYQDEASGAKDLTIDLRVIIEAPATGVTRTVNVNPLTELATRKAGLDGGDGGTSHGADSSTSINTNSITTKKVKDEQAAVAKAVGIGDADDLVSGPVTPTVNADGSDNTANANKYGKALAAISGVERREGKPTTQALDELKDEITEEGLSRGAGDRLEQGAQTAGTSVSVQLVVVTPAITATAIPGSNRSESYREGDTIEITLTMNQAVTVTGTPRIAITIGGDQKYASYSASDSTDTQLVFIYTVQAGDTDTDGIDIVADVDLNGGSIANSFGDNADLSREAIALPRHLVDTTAPARPVLSFSDIGTDTADTITADATITLTGLEAGATWEYSTDNGASWRPGTGNTFELPADATYALGHIQVRQSDAAENISPVGSNASAITLDTVAPTITGLPAINNPPDAATSARHDGSTYRVGDNIDITLTFTKAVTVTGTPTLTINIGGSNAEATYVSGSTTTTLVFRYVVQLGDSDGNGIEIEAGSITLPTGASITDTAGNNATLSYQAVAVDATKTVDGTVPALATATTITLATDNVGSKTDDLADNGVTDDTTPTLSGTINPGLNANEVVQVYNNGVLLGTANVVGTNWTYTLPALAEGDAVLTARVVQLSPGTSIVVAAGNPSADFTLTIDTTVATPTLSLADDTGTESDDNITSNPSINVGDLEAGGTWEFSTDNGDNWNPGAGTSFDLDPNVTYTLGHIQVRQTDAAGNVSAVGSNTAAITTDTNAPTINTVVITPPTGDSFGTGEVITIILTFNENIAVTGVPTLTITTDAGTRDASYTTINANTMMFSYRVQVGDDTPGGISINADALRLNGGTITDTAGNDATITHDAVAASAVSRIAALIAPIDTTTTITAITDNTGSVTGALKSGDSTDETSPSIFSGTISAALQANEQVQVYSGANLLGVATTNGLNWTYENTSPPVLADGATPSYTARVVNTRTNAEGALSDPPFTLTIDTTAPRAPGVTFTDTGTAGDDRTNDLSVTVTGLEAGATWEYSKDNGGTWNKGTATSFDLDADTSYAQGHIQVRQTDAAGNQSAVGRNADVITTDNTAPTITGVLIRNPNNGDTFGRGETIEIVVDLSEAVTVTGVPTITIDIGGTDQVASYDAAGSSAARLIFHYSVQAGDRAPNGIRIVSGNIALPASATIKDTAANDLNPAHGAVAIDAGKKVEALAALLTTEATIVSVTDNVGTAGVVLNPPVALNTNDTTNDATPTLSGTINAPLQAGEEVRIYNGIRLLGVATISGGTNWSYTPAALADGQVNLIARVESGAGGNRVIGPDSATFILTIDTTVATPGLTIVDTGSANNDNITTNPTVTVTGLEAGGSWEYVIDGSTNWIAGTGSNTITLGANNSYAIGVIKVRQTDAAGNQSAVGSNAAVITTDATAPTVTSVAITAPTPPATGFVESDDIVITVVFSQAVNVSLAALVEITLGTGTVNAYYDSGNNTNTITFKYTVQSGDNDADGISIEADAISGTITDIAGNDANLAHDAVVANVANLVDTTAPTITGAAITSTAAANDTYGTGEVISITVTFSEAITVTGGAPTLAFRIGNTNVQASYNAASSGANTMVFDYTVLLNQQDANGISIPSGRIDLGGATITDARGLNADLSVSAVADQATHLVDARANAADYPTLAFADTPQPATRQSLIGTAGLTAGIRLGANTQAGDNAALQTPTAAAVYADGADDASMPASQFELGGIRVFLGDNVNIGPSNVTTVAIGNKTYLLVTVSDDDSVQLIDVSDPAAAKQIASLADTLALELGSPLGITTVVIGGVTYALVAASTDNGVQILDISTDPANPAPIATADDGQPDSNPVMGDQVNYSELEGANDLTTVVIKGKTYALVTAFGDDGVQIIDISTPRAPIAVAAITDSTALANTPYTELDGASAITTVVIKGKTYALIAAQTDDGVQIIDISTPETPKPVAAITDGAGGFTALDGAIAITTVKIGDATYALVASSSDSAVQIIDISDPTAPTAVGALFDDSIQAGSPYTALGGVRAISTTVIAGRTYALVSGSNNVQIIDITDPTAPTAVAALTDSTVATPTTYTELSDARDITTAIINNKAYAFVAGYGDLGIQVIELPISATISTITITTTGLDADGDEQLAYGTGAGQVLVIGAANASASNLSIGGVAGIDIAWDRAAKTITLTKHGGGNLTTIEVEAILAALRYQNANAATATDGERTFSITLTDADGLTSTTPAVHSVNVNAATVIGDDNDNRYDATAGADFIDGKGGTDTVSYAGATDGMGVTVDLSDNANNANGFAAGDVLNNIENLIGTPNADTLTGDANDNRLEGGGRGDTLSGGDGDDTLDGGAGSDTLDGGAGDDILIGGTGRDTLRGGTGIDTVSYAASAAGVTVDLGLGNAPQGGAGDARRDVLTGIENIDGSGHDDVLTGDANANVIKGGAGDDTLISSGGADTLTGDGGADRFVIKPGHGDITITDFDTANDTLDLSALVGFTNLAAVQGATADAGANTVITTAYGDITLIGVQEAQLSDGNLSYFDSSPILDLNPADAERGLSTLTNNAGLAAGLALVDANTGSRVNDHQTITPAATFAIQDGVNDGNGVAFELGVPGVIQAANQGPTAVSTVEIGGSTYLLVTERGGDSVQIINVDNPAAPTQVGSFANTANRKLDNPAAITTVKIGNATYALIASHADNGVQIINISGPANPSATAAMAIGDGTNDSAGNTFSALRGAFAITTVTISNATYALVTSALDNGVQIIDISDPTDPKAVSAVFDDSVNPASPYTALRLPNDISTVKIGVKTYALVTSVLDDGVQIIDISTPATPKPVAALFDDNAVADSPYTTLRTASALTTVVIGVSTYALVASEGDDGVQIIDISTPETPKPVAVITDGVDGYTTLQDPVAITTVVIGDATYALVASNADDGVQIIDITDPENPSAVAALTDTAGTELDAASAITTAVINGKTYAFVAGNDDLGVQVIELSPPATITTITITTTGLEATNEQLVYGTDAMGNALTLAIGGAADVAANNVTIAGIAGINIVWDTSENTITLSKNAGNLITSEVEVILNALRYRNTVGATGDDAREFSIVLTDAEGLESTAAVRIVNVDRNAAVAIAGGPEDNSYIATDDPDNIDGGGGSDSVSYAGSDAGVSVDLSDNAANAGGYAQGDTLDKIENLIGSDHNDILTGDDQANRLEGGGGADTLTGGAGADTLIGGAGADTLTGGADDDRLIGGAGDDTLTGNAGDDVFVFASGHGSDTITDFDAGVDKIDLSAFTTIKELADVTLAVNAGIVRITTPGGGIIDLTGVLRTAQITAADIIVAPSTITAITIAAPTTGNTFVYGETITFTVSFEAGADLAVSGGTPSLSFAIDGGTRRASYDADASTATTMVFSYRVQDGDTDADGLSINANALVLNGATITSRAGRGRVSFEHDAIAADATKLIDAPSATLTTTARITHANDSIGAVTGRVADGAITDDPSPTLVGTLSQALGANEEIWIYKGQTLVGKVTSAAPTTHAWSYTIQEALLHDANPSYRVRVVNTTTNAVGAFSNRFGFTIDTEVLTPVIEPIVDTATDGDGVTSTNTVTVSNLETGAGSFWRYSTDNGNTWKVGTGNTFSLADGEYQINQIQVSQVDITGNRSPVVKYDKRLVVDATPPRAPTLALANDDGAKNNDNITSDGRIDVSHLEGGTTTWEYSIDNGKNWQAGTAGQQFFTLTPGTYPGGHIQVRQTDLAGNVSPIYKYNQTIVIRDTAIPTVQSIAITSTPTNPDGFYRVGEMIEVSVTFSETVWLNRYGNRPSGNVLTLTINIGGIDVVLDNVHKTELSRGNTFQIPSDSGTLRFTHTLTAADRYDSDGIVIGANPINLNYAANLIQDLAGNAATLNFKAQAANAAHKVLVQTAVDGDGNANTFAATATAERFDGKTGVDTLNYASSPTGVSVDLSSVGLQSGGYAENDTLVSIENLIGSDRDDTLTGNTAANVLTGGAGDDTLSGGAGRDMLTGGAGDDTLTGGAGADGFVFSGAHGQDTIRDFSLVGGDFLDLRAYRQFLTLQNLRDATKVSTDGNDLIITTSPGNTIRLVGINDVNDLTNGDFLAPDPVNLPASLNLGLKAGINLNLIHKFTAGGKTYYYLDYTGNNAEGNNDRLNHNILSLLFNDENGGADIIATQPGGAVVGVDDERTFLVNNLDDDQNYTVVLPTHAELVALRQAVIAAPADARKPGVFVPKGWRGGTGGGSDGDWYWAADISTTANNHRSYLLHEGRGDAQDPDTDAYFIAVQVIADPVQRAVRYHNIDPQYYEQFETNSEINFGLQSGFWLRAVNRIIVGGKAYYHLQQPGGGTGNDAINHDVLDAIFNDGADTTNVARTIVVISGDYRYIITLANNAELTAINNAIVGTPPGWVSGAYWSATQGASPGEHKLYQISADARATFSDAADTVNAYAAVQIEVERILTKADADNTITQNPAVTSTVISSTPAGGDTYGIGENVDVTLVFSEAVYVSGLPTVALEIAGVNRNAVYHSGSGTDTLVFRYQITRHDATDNDGIEIKVGNIQKPNNADIFNYYGSVTNLAYQGVLPDPTQQVAGPLPLTLDLGTINGVHLKLIGRYITDAGKTYYYLDVSDNGLEGTLDRLTHDKLDQLFNNGTDTAATQANGAVVGVDDARTLIVSNLPGGRDYTVVLPTRAELVALRTNDLADDDASRINAGVRVPKGWRGGDDDDYYWAADRIVAGTHGLTRLHTPRNSQAGDTASYYVALEVLDNSVQRDISYVPYTSALPDTLDLGSHEAIPLRLTGRYELDGKSWYQVNSGQAINHNLLDKLFNEGSDTTSSYGARTTQIISDGRIYTLQLPTIQEFYQLWLAADTNRPTGWGGGEADYYWLANSETMADRHRVVNFNATQVFSVPDTGAYKVALAVIDVHTIDAPLAVAGTAAPQVDDISIISSPPPNQPYAAGNPIDIKLSYTDSVFVSGIPTIKIAIGSADVTASYISGSGSEDLVFRYTVPQSGSVVDTNGISIKAGTVGGRGARIQGVGGAAINNHKALANDPAHQVDNRPLPDSLDLGVRDSIHLNFINHVTTPDGKHYYYLDRSGNDLEGGDDVITHAILDQLFNDENGGADTVATQLGGAVAGVDDERSVVIDNLGDGKQYTVVLPTADELTMLYNYNARKTPSNWRGGDDDDYYWTADVHLHGDRHAAVRLHDGRISGANDGGLYYGAVQILVKEADRQLRYESLLPEDLADSYDFGQHQHWLLALGRVIVGGKAYYRLQQPGGGLDNDAVNHNVLDNLFNDGKDTTNGARNIKIISGDYRYTISLATVPELLAIHNAYDPTAMPNWPAGGAYWSSRIGTGLAAGPSGPETHDWLRIGGNGGVTFSSPDSAKLYAAVEISAERILGKDADDTTITQNPTITNIGISSMPNDSGFYAVTNHIDVSVQFSEVVYVSGAPQIALNIGNSGNHKAVYERGSGTDTLIFRYVVDINTPNDLDGISVTDNILQGADYRDSIETPNGAKIYNYYGALDSAELSYDVIRNDVAHRIKIERLEDNLNLGLKAGINLNLINRFTMNDGKNYYYFDYTGNNAEGNNDRLNHNTLSLLFNDENGGADIIATQPGGAVAGVDDERTFLVNNLDDDRSYTVVLPTIAELVALRQAVIVAPAGARKAGEFVPKGWRGGTGGGRDGDWYWAADISTTANNHRSYLLHEGRGDAQDPDTDAYFVAVQVIAQAFERDFSYQPIAPQYYEQFETNNEINFGLQGGYWLRAVGWVVIGGEAYYYLQQPGSGFANDAINHNVLDAIFNDGADTTNAARSIQVISGDYRYTITLANNTELTAINAAYGNNKLPTGWPPGYYWSADRTGADQHARYRPHDDSATFVGTADADDGFAAVKIAVERILSKADADNTITQNPTVASTVISSTPAGGGTYRVGEDVDVTLTFSEAVYVSGKPTVALEIAGINRNAAYHSGSGTDTLVFRYRISRNDVADSDGVEIKVGNIQKPNNSDIFNFYGSVTNLAYQPVLPDPTQKVVGPLPQTLDLGTINGVHLKLIGRYITDAGKTYYYLDVSDNGLEGTLDRLTHDKLDQLFNNGTDTAATQANGAVVGVDDARTLIVSNLPGGRDYTVVLPTRAELVALRTNDLADDDASRINAGVRVPKGWRGGDDDDYYWAADRIAAGAHGLTRLHTPRNNQAGDTASYYVALEVLDNLVQRDIYYEPVALVRSTVLDLGFVDGLRLNLVQGKRVGAGGRIYNIYHLDANGGGSATSSDVVSMSALERVFAGGADMTADNRTVTVDANGFRYTLHVATNEEIAAAEAAGGLNNWAFNSWYWTADYVSANRHVNYLVRNSSEQARVSGASGDAAGAQTAIVLSKVEVIQNDLYNNSLVVTATKDYQLDFVPGKNALLINGVALATGGVIYHLDADGDGIADSGDNLNHSVLDSLFNKGADTTTAARTLLFLRDGLVYKLELATIAELSAAYDSGLSGWRSGNYWSADQDGNKANRHRVFNTSNKAIAAAGDAGSFASAVVLTEIQLADVAPPTVFDFGTQSGVRLSFVSAVRLANGSKMYHLDLNGNGISDAGDKITHTLLDNLFNKGADTTAAARSIVVTQAGLDYSLSLATIADWQQFSGNLPSAWGRDYYWTADLARPNVHTGFHSVNKNIGRASDTASFYAAVVINDSIDFGIIDGVRLKLIGGLTLANGDQIYHLDNNNNGISDAADKVNHNQLDRIFNNLFDTTATVADRTISLTQGGETYTLSLATIAEWQQLGGDLPSTWGSDYYWTADRARVNAHRLFHAADKNQNQAGDTAAYHAAVVISSKDDAVVGTNTNQHDFGTHSGVDLQLINGVYLPGRGWLFHLDSDGNGAATGADALNHNQLDTLFNNNSDTTAGSRARMITLGTTSYTLSLAAVNELREAADIGVANWNQARYWAADRTGANQHQTYDVAGKVVANEADAVALNAAVLISDISIGARISEVAITSTPRVGKHYRAGEIVEITFTFSAPVQLVGDTEIGLRIGSATRKAGYVGGSGTNTLVFNYRLTAADTDTNGIDVQGDSLALIRGSTLATTTGGGVSLAHTVVFGGDDHKVAPKPLPDSINFGVQLSSGVIVNLIKGIQTADGRMYYHLDYNNNGLVDYGDRHTHNELDKLFNGGTDTIATQPGVGGARFGVDDARTFNIFNKSGHDYTLVLPTIAELLEVRLAAGGPSGSAPTGWRAGNDDWYWAAERAKSGYHKTLSLVDARRDNEDEDTDGYYSAIQVIADPDPRPVAYGASQLPTESSLDFGRQEGYRLKLIAGNTVAGKRYYHISFDGDNSADGDDKANHNVLDILFNNSQDTTRADANRTRIIDGVDGKRYTIKLANFEELVALVGQNWGADDWYWAADLGSNSGKGKAADWVPAIHTKNGKPIEPFTRENLAGQHMNFHPKDAEYDVRDSDSNTYYAAVVVTVQDPTGAGITALNPPTSAAKGGAGAAGADGEQVANPPTSAAQASTTDSLDFSAALAAVTVDLNDQAASDTHVIGSAYDDVIVGNDADNNLQGRAGDDILTGGVGDDMLIGGAGDDILTGGVGDDTLIGGTGADTFVFFGSEYGNDLISDFTAGEDKIDLSAIAEFVDLDAVKQVAADDGKGNVVITTGDDQTITIAGVEAEDLTAAYFNFAVL